MRQTNNEKEELNLLRRKGFTEREITRLYQLRRTYAQDEMDQAALDTRHLEFVRWLVTTGRLSDQISADPSQ